MAEAQAGFKGEEIRFADFDETKYDPVQSAVNTFVADEIDGKYNYMGVGVYQKENQVYFAMVLGGNK